MKHGSLFSGIGGFDLAAQWMGWENVFHCEWNPFGQKVLKYYWPEAISYEDITKTDFTIHEGKIDILTGGFPCQPYSVAGLRKGKEDERHLWPEMLRAIREIKPRWVVGENVLGLVGWNGGLVFEEVQTDLEAEGYEVQPYVLPAASVGAPHRRDRVWFVAYAKCNGHDADQGIEKGQQSSGRRPSRSESTSFIESQSSADSDSINRGIESQHSSSKPEGTRNKSDRSNTEDQSEWRDLKYIFESPGEYTEFNKKFASNTKSEGLQESGQTGISELSAEDKEQLDDRSKLIGSATSNDNQFDGNVSRFRAGGVSQQQEAGLQLDNASNSNSEQRCKRRMHQNGSEAPERHTCSCDACSNKRPDWDEFPTQPPVCSGNDGISAELDGITFSKWRTESIKAAGNAIVPQVVYQIFKAIEQYELPNQTPQP